MNSSPLFQASSSRLIFREKKEVKYTFILFSVNVNSWETKKVPQPGLEQGGLNDDASVQALQPAYNSTSEKSRVMGKLPHGEKQRKSSRNHPPENTTLKSSDFA